MDGKTGNELVAIDNEVAQVQQLAAKPVTDQASYNEAAATLKACKGILKTIDNLFDPLIKSANDSVKAIRDQKKAHAGPVEIVEGQLRASTSKYIFEQEQVKIAEEKRRSDEAAAEEKRRKEEAKAENEFLAEIGMAETVVAAPVVTVPVQAVDQAGLSFREVWKFEIDNLASLPREFLIPNEKMIGEIVRSMKGLTSIPGVRVWPEKTAVVR